MPYTAAAPEHKPKFTRREARPPGADSGLPKGWDKMSLGALWDALNDPRRWPRAAQSTVDAVAYELRTYGLPQLAKPATQARLSDLSNAQVRHIIACLIRLRPKYPTITDDLLLKLGGLL
jgi:hypothetical protein